MIRSKFIKITATIIVVLIILSIIIKLTFFQGVFSSRAYKCKIETFAQHNNQKIFWEVDSKNNKKYVSNKINLDKDVYTLFYIYEDAKALYIKSTIYSQSPININHLSPCLIFTDHINKKNIKNVRKAITKSLMKKNEIISVNTNKNTSIYFLSLINLDKSKFIQECTINHIKY